MSGYAGNNRNRNYNDDRRNSGSTMRGSRNSGRSFQNRIPAQRAMISPWESGVSPANTASSSLLGALQSTIQNQIMLNQASINDNNYNMPNKFRRLDGGGNFDDRNVRGLYLSPNTSLMGAAPQNLSYAPRSSNLQQRLGTNWSSDNSTADWRTRSGYYPSNSRRDHSSRSQSNRQSRSTRETQNRPRYSDRNTSAKSDKDKPISKDRDAKSPVKDESVETPQEENKEGQESKVNTEASKEGLVKTEKNEDSFLSKVLFCHVCDLDTFQTKKGFIRHLEGITHSRMSEKFHEKNATRLQYLTVSAKFAEMKRKDHLIRMSGCKNRPLGKVAERFILKKNMVVEDCCNKTFSNAFDLHEHKLSVVHLRNLHEKGTPEKSLRESTINLHTASAEEAEEMIKSAKKAVDAEPHSVTNLTAYDPKLPFGLNYIEQVVQYKCDVCRVNVSSLEDHCQTYKHYTNILSSIKREEERNLEKEKRKEKKEKLEESKEEKPEKQASKFERSMDEDCDSNFSDKNEETKDFLSYEDLIKDDEIIILDEEKTEDEELNFEPEVTAEEKPATDDTLNDESPTILDDMADEPITEDGPTVDTAVLVDDIQPIGDDFMDTEVVEEEPQQPATDVEVEQPAKTIQPRRSFRVRL